MTGHRGGPPVRAMLFDLDDTLLDHRGAARDALLSWSGRYAEPTPDLEARWQVLETTYYAQFQAGELTRDEQRRARVRAFFPRLDLSADRDADAVFDGYWTAYVAAWRPFADALPALERAQALGLSLGILTNGLREDQERKVAATGLDRLRVPLVASSELGVAKPHPAAFAAACRRLGSTPAETMMVGDHPVTDIRGARGAGLGAVLLDRYGQHPEEPGPRIQSLDELEPAL